MTRRGLTLLIVLTLLGTAAQWSGGRAVILAWLIAVAVAIALFCADLMMARARRVDGQCVSASVVPLGRPVTVGVAFEAAGAGIVRLQFRPELPPGLVTDEVVRTVHWPAPGRLMVNWEVLPVELGAHLWASLPVRIGGRLGLLWSHRRLPLSSTFIVVPDRALVAPAVPLLSGPGFHHRIVTGPGHEVLQLREYRRVDSRHSIDWKASARMARLIVRDFAADHGREIMFAIDVGRTSGIALGNLSRLGHFANLVSAVVGRVARDDDRVGVLGFADGDVYRAPPLRAATLAPRLNRLLAGFKTQPVESSPLVAAARLQTMVRRRSLVIIMTGLDDTALTSQLARAVSLLAPKHLVLLVDLLDPELRNLATMPVTRWTDPCVALAAQEYRAGIRANCARLECLGARVLLTSPATADRDLVRACREVEFAGRI